MCSRTGWTWDYVWEELGVDRIEELEKHWANEPPVDVLVAQFLGFKRKGATTQAPARIEPPRIVEGKVDLPPPKSRVTAAQVEELMGLFPGGTIKPR